MKIVGKEIEKVPPTHLVTDLRRLLLLIKAECPTVDFKPVSRCTVLTALHWPISRLI